MKAIFYVKQVSCIVSVICSLVVILTYKISHKWTEEFRYPKQMLFCLSVYLMATGVGLFLQPPPDDSSSAECQVQSSLVEMFGVGAAFYDAFLSIEMKIHIDNIFKGNYAFNRHGPLLRFRHKVMHLFALFYGIGIITWMDVTTESGSVDGVCWIENPTLLVVFALLPVWISMIIVIYCNYSIITSFRSLAGDSGVVIRFQGKSKYLLRRMLAIPVIFVLLWLPASILRLASVLDYNITDRGMETLAFIWIITFSSAGTLNATMYVFTDGRVCRAWATFLCGWTGCVTAVPEGSDTSFEGPASEYLEFSDRSDSRSEFGASRSLRKLAESSKSDIDEKSGAFNILWFMSRKSANESNLSILTLALFNPNSNSTSSNPSGSYRKSFGTSYRSRTRTSLASQLSEKFQVDEGEGEDEEGGGSAKAWSAQASNGSNSDIGKDERILQAGKSVEMDVPVRMTDTDLSQQRPTAVTSFVLPDSISSSHSFSSSLRSSYADNLSLCIGTQSLSAPANSTLSTLHEIESISDSDLSFQAASAAVSTRSTLG